MNRKDLIQKNAQYYNRSRFGRVLFLELLYIVFLFFKNNLDHLFVIPLNAIHF